MKDNKVRCSIARKLFVDDNGNPSDKGTPVYCWCEDLSHKKPVPLFSSQQEAEHDKEYHR